MSSFNVLDPKLNIHRNFFIEASAGTGKTFSIENIVLRLLTEGDNPLKLEEILVVTFTKAATRDLKSRIRSNIEKNLFKMKSRLQNALFCFDQAQIYTIHSFCYRMLNDHLLEGDVVFVDEDPLPRSEILRVIRDFFRTEIIPEKFHQSEIKVLFKIFQNNIESLEENLISVITQRKKIEEFPFFNEKLIRFNRMMKSLSIDVNSTVIVDDFINIAPSFKGLCDRSKAIKKDILENVYRFAQLFDRSNWSEDDFGWIIEDQLSYLKYLDPLNLGKKEYASNLSSFRERLNEEMIPLIHSNTIFASIACHCKNLLEKYIEQEEKFNFDDLLKMMFNDSLKQVVQKKYRAVIIDEFQDTDPLQWKIFEDLFSNSNGYLYLVGDPKQSIYAFRDADIYTYIKASEALGKDCFATLDTNYRSQKDLVNALNETFSTIQFPLPSINDHLLFKPVHSSKEKFLFSDDKKALHFFVAEGDSMEELEKTKFFPFILNEIRKFDFNQSAILVSDRFQAQRLLEYLKSHKIPVVSVKSGYLSESTALSAMRELLKAAITPKHESSLKIALGGELIGWSHEQIRDIEDHFEDVLLQMSELGNTLFNHGFGLFYQEFLNSKWNRKETVREYLLSQENGDKFLDEFEQIAELICEYQIKSHVQPDGLLSYLNELKLKAYNEDESLKIRSDTSFSAVSILTLHSSKGLEFDIVFTLGLVKRTKQPELLYPKCDVLTPVINKNDPYYQQYLEEIDAEKMRLLYVGLTRAKTRVYAPVIQYSKEAKNGCTSPMELFFNKNFESMENVSCSYLSEDVIIEPKKDIKDPPFLIPPKKVNLLVNPLYLQSFTYLTKKLPSSEYSKSPPNDYNPVEKNAHTLPSGTEIGIILHKILEVIPFHRDDEIFSYVEKYVKDTKFCGWENTIAEMIIHLLKIPLPSGFSLKDLNPNKMYREMEFLYPYDDHLKVKCDPGFLKGVIDLVFEHEGKYYIIDWKSNWLGPTCEDYRLESLEKAMEEHHYTIQGKIYYEAMRRYLKIFDSSGSIGGVYYIFLRGVDMKGNGIICLD